MNPPGNTTRPVSGPPVGAESPQRREKVAFRLGLGISVVVHLAAIAAYAWIGIGSGGMPTESQGELVEAPLTGTDVIEIVEVSEPEPTDEPAPPEDSAPEVERPPDARLAELPPPLPEVADEPPPDIPAVPDDRISVDQTPDDPAPNPESTADSDADDPQPENVPDAVADATDSGEDRTLGERLRPRAMGIQLLGALREGPGSLTDTERAELLLRGLIQDWNDSVAIAAAIAQSGRDWTTTDSQGRRWGIASDGIYLGDISIPYATGILAGILSGLLREGSVDRLGWAERQWILQDLARSTEAAMIRESWADRAREVRARLDAERDAAASGNAPPSSNERGRP